MPERPRGGAPWTAAGALGAAVALELRGELLSPVDLRLILVAGAGLGAAHMWRRRGTLARRLGRAVHHGLVRRRIGRLEPGEHLGVTPEGRGFVLEERQLSAHGLILGASGAGKSTTLVALLAERMRAGRPAVVLDMKGSPSFAAALREAAGEAGRPYALWTPDGPAAWNPVRHGNPTELKDKLIAAERFTEPHYQRSAERYLQTALGVGQALGGPTGFTLDRVVELLDPRRLAAEARRLPGDRAEAVLSYLDSLGPDALSAARGLATRLALVTESHTGRFLSPCAGGPEIDLHEALLGDGLTLFSLNASRYGKLAAQLGTMIVQDLVSATGRRLVASPPPAPGALVAIDEFSALGAGQVLGLFARAREAGVAVLVATQELADLDVAARGLRDQILGNTALKIVHRQDVPGSAATVSALAGSEPRWQLTERLAAPGFLRSGVGGGGRPTRTGGGGTRRAVEAPIVHPDEVKRLRTGEAVIITKVPRTEVSRVRILPVGRDRGVER